MNYHDEVNEELEELLPLEDIDAWQERIDNMINVEMCNDEDDRVIVYRRKRDNKQRRIDNGFRTKRVGKENSRRS